MRLGDRSFENIVRTDERYGHDGFWLGPRGRDYGALLEHPKPYQIANLYPDSNASYWIAQYELPVGAKLTLHGRFAHCRYMSFALYRPDPLGSFTATSEAIVDHEITPDPGSVNPFVPGNPRLGENRNYTVHIVGEEAPARRDDPALRPESAPARNPPVMERYVNNAYSFVGVFKSKEARAKIPHKIETGFGGDPVTLYMFSWVSRAFGPVLVLRGKMPKFPNTFLGKGKGLETMTDWESRYWSLIICEAPPSGLSNDGLTDMQVPLDRDGNYTIVISREEDRPANATDANAVAWMDWGTRGEGLDDPKNRANFGMLVFRYMYNNPDWKNNPQKITVPGTEAEVMGPYYPRAEYMDKATFEARGPKR
jgi:hypothetical protein